MLKHPISPTVDCVFKSILGSREDQWLYFFKEAENWRELPEIINTPEMRQAMAVLKRFSEKEADYHLYQARQNAIREEKTRQMLLEEALRRERRGSARKGRGSARKGRGPAEGRRDSS